MYVTSSSSSSIGCGAGDHKVSPCMTIISKCGNLLFLHCPFIIPKQSVYIIKVWSTWSTRSPFANDGNVQSISYNRLFLWHSEDVTKKFQLAVPNQMNQRIKNEPIWLYLLPSLFWGSAPCMDLAWVLRRVNADSYAPTFRNWLRPPTSPSRPSPLQKPSHRAICNACMSAKCR